MKSKLFLLLSLFSGYTMSAQLTITPGAQISIAGNGQLTLQNTDLINNGSFETGKSVISFTGNVSSSIRGSQLVQFHELEMNKTNNTLVILQQAVGVTHRILFTSGLFDLNGFNTDLGNTGSLENEDETRHVIGANGGQLLLNTVLDAPVNANPGNLGAVITSSQNLGNVIIKRGHKSQAGLGSVNSLFRYYEIDPEKNSNLDASLQINYFDGELNGLDENSLVFFKSDDGVTWSNEGFNSRNTNGNFIDKTGINSFSRWTLSNDNNPLAVHFILFNVNCEGNKVLITWKTAQEQYSNHFDIERSIDGIRWTVVGNLPAAGNSNTEISYSFTDNSPLQNSFYRIAEHDLNGRVQYTSVLQSSCNTANTFTLWPNPVSDRIFINIVTDNASQVIIKVFDGKGALIKMQRADVVRGSNQLSVDMGSLAKGVYTLYADWNSGQTKKAVQVLKQ